MKRTKQKNGHMGQIKPSLTKALPVRNGLPSKPLPDAHSMSSTTAALALWLTKNQASYAPFTCRTEHSTISPLTTWDMRSAKRSSTSNSISTESLHFFAHSSHRNKMQSLPSPLSLISRTDLSVGECMQSYFDNHIITTADAHSMDEIIHRQQIEELKVQSEDLVSPKKEDRACSCVQFKDKVYRLKKEHTATLQMYDRMSATISAM
jgi:hypothetical protein